MTRPEQLSQVEEALGYQFPHVRDIHDYFNDPEVYPDSYREVMTECEEMLRDANGGTAFGNKEGQLLGINLYGLKDQLDPGKIQEMLALDLPHLQVLNLNETGVTSFTFSQKYPRLQHVNLSQNDSLTEIHFESNPQDLVSLHAYDSRVQSLDFPAGLAEFVKLDIARNQKLTSLSFGGPVPKLWYVDAAENELKTFRIPAGSNELQYLFLRKNKLEELEFGGGMKALESLDLRVNQLKELPNNFLEVTTGLTHLFLYDNPWESIRDAVSSNETGNSYQEVASFLTSLKGDVDFLFEAKMILVGNGEVGKTSIRTKLIDESAPLPKKEERTQVIEVVPYEIENLPSVLTGHTEKVDFTFNIWDFGGQGKYREIQQIFCSPQSLYIFVTAHDDQPDELKLEEDYVSFEYWLDMVTAYGHHLDSDHSSPVLLVINKIDQEYGSINKGKYLKEYPHIHKQEIHISCQTLQNFSQLRDKITELIPSISTDIFSTKRNAKWLSVKEELERLREEEDRKHISFKDYQEICTQNGLSDQDAKTWIGMLNRVGTVIYFRDHPELNKLIILDPDWVRQALYMILDSKLLKRGVFNPGFFDSIWPNHSQEEQQAFVDLMLEYKLCFDRKDNFGETEFVVPACLPSEEPTLPHFLQKPTYRIKIHYEPFVPAGTVNKLMVSIQGEMRHSFPGESRIADGELKVKFENSHLTIYNNLMWKNNAIIHDSASTSYAHVSEDWDNKTVNIDLFNTQDSRLYTSLETLLKGLNEDLRATRYVRNLRIRTTVEDRGTWVDMDYIRDKGELFFKNATGDFENPIQENQIDPIPMTKKILFLAANPSNATRIQTDTEHRKLKAEYERGEASNKAEFLPPEFAVTIGQLQRALDAEPNIIHFSGHGLEDGIIITTEQNESILLGQSPLNRIFKRIQKQAELVILNACFSASQAKIISDFGIYVIGANHEVLDDACIEFSKAFYSALGRGKPYEQAYDEAITSIGTYHPEEEEKFEAWYNGEKLDW